MKKSKRNPSLSIIITSYTMDRFKGICELFDSLKSQTLLNQQTQEFLELIFVAERSRELFEKAKSYLDSRLSTEEHRITTKVLFNDGELGLSAARNLGIKHATGEIIAFVDDDVLLFPEWAEEMIKGYDDDSIIGVTGPAYPLWEDESMSWFPEEFYWIISCTAWSGWNEKREVRNAWGMNMSFKREAFQECGVFDNEFGFYKGLMPEDNEFSLRARRKTRKHIIYNPDVKVWHRVLKYRLSWKFVQERAYWIGYSRRNMKQSYLEEGKLGSLFTPEHQLLKRIFTKTFPDILKTFFKNPVIAWRKLSVTFTVLFFVALGYYSHLLPRSLKK